MFGMTPLQAIAQTQQLGYGPILVLIAVGSLLAGSIILISHALPKAKRRGHDKEGTYESGVEPIGDARRRFNVKFYLVAMLFLLFDVELIFMYPSAKVFTEAKASGQSPVSMTFLFCEMGIFFAILLVGYIYAWSKGVFRYD